MDRLIELDEPRSISQLYAELTACLDERWGRSRQVWVTGEIQKLSEHRSGHCYVDLVDPHVARRDAPVLKAKCWRSTWAPLRGSLRGAGLALEEGSVVKVRGYVDLYAPRGELGFIITAIDTEALRAASLGEHARRREDLLRRLAAESLIERNASRPMCAVPVHVGLVASQGTEGCNDFLGMLEASGFSFRVSLARAAVQGPSAPAELAAGVRTLANMACDVICIVRGGGSQADLSAFDDERVARAIARCDVPVYTGIGHTGDVAVADLVAARAFRTPTACAEALATLVRDWYGENVAEPARRIDDAVRASLDEVADSVSQSRRHVVVVGRHHLARASALLEGRASRVARRAPRVTHDAGSVLAARTRRLAPLTRRCIATAAAADTTRRALLAAYDPRRLLERGWSITTGEDGHVVRSVATLSSGTELSTRFADGVARSKVTGLERAAEEAR